MAERPDWLHGDVFFFTKNGLSAFLMKQLWLQWRSGAARFFYDEQVTDHAENIRECLREERLLPGRVEPLPLDAPASLAARARAGLGRLLGRPPVVCHTLSMPRATRLRVEAFGPRARHLIVEHGTVEMFRYVEGCERGERDERRIFLLAFHAEVMDLLARRGIEPTLAARPFPFLLGLHEKVRTSGIRRSLFAMQNLVDWEVVSEADCRSVLDAFLDRRPPVTYVLKPHPRGGARTLVCVRDALERRGLPYEVLPQDSPITETHFPVWDCQEVSTFYSTSAWLCRRIYGVPCDVALGELSRLAAIRTDTQRDLTALLASLFPTCVSTS